MPERDETDDCNPGRCFLFAMPIAVALWGVIFVLARMIR